MNLAIDIGNSRTKIALFSSQKIKKLKILTGSKVNNFILKHNPEYIGISSVVSSATDNWIKICKNKLQIKPLIISNKIKLPLNLKVKKSYNLGSDRICNAAWGYEYFGRRENVIVISFGTATTYDIVLKNGDYLGGIIIPGLNLAAKALHSYTSELPLVDFNKRVKIFLYGNDTHSSIKNGIINSAVFTTNNFIKSMRLYMRKRFKIMLTGGFFPILENMFDFDYIEEKYSVLKGINLLINYNH